MTGAAPIHPTAAAPAVAPPRIKSFTLCDFRAFAGPEPVTFRLDGKNLLVYGENGAGKSSIFHALNELFSVELVKDTERQARFTELRNRFSGAPSTVGLVQIEFDDGKPPARWDATHHPVDITPASDPRIVNGAYRKAVLDYRALLDTNYRHGSGAVNLFHVCVHVLLRDYPAAHGGRQRQLLDLWRELSRFLVSKQLRARDISAINALCASFNQGLRDALDLLRTKVDDLLPELGWDDVKLTALTTPGLTYNNGKTRAARAFDGMLVSPEISFRSLAISAPQTFLNEARLSALALAIYLAGRQVCAATLQTDTPRLMVLDDVLIGLDQSNRLPVLLALDRHFPDWQIVLLTHDRVWYEMARFHLADRSDWAAVEMFEEKKPDGTPVPIAGPVNPFVRPAGVDAVTSNIDTARRFCTAHEYSASAVHARVAFELSLKNVCQRKAIPVRFQTDPRKLTTDDLLNAIEFWLGHASRAAMKAAVEPKIAKLRMWRKVVLNPFSHSTPVSLTAGEVKGAIDAVAALHQAFKDDIP